MLAANLQIFRLNSVYGGQKTNRANPSYDPDKDDSADNVALIDYYKRTLDPAALFEIRGS